MSDEKEEDVIIHEATVVGQATEEDRPKARHYERATPLPSRIRDGSFEEAHIDAAGQEIPYESIEYVALGVIDQMVKDSELKKGPLRQMVKKVTAGEDKESGKARAKQTREIYLLDVFTTLQEQPFRFEGSSVNYKSFLDKVGYVSFHNFFRFCVHFARKVPHATCTSSLGGLLAKRREKIAHFSDYHDFEMEVQQQRINNRDLMQISDLDLSRDSWMDEWTDDDI